MKRVQGPDETDPALLDIITGVHKDLLENFSRREKKTEDKYKTLTYIQKLHIKHYIILEHGKLFKKREKIRRQGEKTYLYSIFWQASY